MDRLRDLLEQSATPFVPDANSRARSPAAMLPKISREQEDFPPANEIAQRLIHLDKYIPRLKRGE
jgi:hypothetical protein